MVRHICVVLGVMLELFNLFDLYLDDFDLYLCDIDLFVNIFVGCCLDICSLALPLKLNAPSDLLSKVPFLLEVMC